MICQNCNQEKGDAIICPYCHTGGTVKTMPHHLPVGTVIHDRYRIDGTLGEGGFGITYIGEDNRLDRIVAIKEFFPHGFSYRNTTESNEVIVSSGSSFDYFTHGRKRFLDEAKILAKFSFAKGIVNVIDFVEENNTAYLIMEYLDGVTLRDYLKEKGALSPDQTFGMLMPVINALEKAHAQKIIHRDISPDNIMMCNNGDVVLMDFGAAREYAADERTLSVMLKKGYAPEEQYRTNGAQGPWTDVYGLCATIYRCITGKTPEESLDRVVDDRLKRPSELGVRIRPELENLLMYGLSVRAEDRCQSMTELKRLLSYALPQLTASRPTPGETSDNSTAPLSPDSERGRNSAPKDPAPYPHRDSARRDRDLFATKYAEDIPPAHNGLAEGALRGTAKKASAQPVELTPIKRVGDRSSVNQPSSDPRHIGASDHNGSQRRQNDPYRQNNDPYGPSPRSPYINSTPGVAYPPENNNYNNHYDNQNIINDQTPAKKKKSSKAAPIISVIAILLVVGIVIGVLYYNGVFDPSNKKEDDPTEVPATESPLRVVVAESDPNAVLFQSAVDYVCSTQVLTDFENSPLNLDGYTASSSGEYSIDKTNNYYHTAYSNKETKSYNPSLSCNINSKAITVGSTPLGTFLNDGWDFTEDSNEVKSYSSDEQYGIIGSGNNRVTIGVRDTGFSLGNATLTYVGITDLNDRSANTADFSYNEITSADSLDSVVQKLGTPTDYIINVKDNVAKIRAFYSFTGQTDYASFTFEYNSSDNSASMLSFELES